MPTECPQRDQTRLLAVIAAGISAWIAAVVLLVVTMVPTEHYLISYYIADYGLGFVRRGLAGELAGPVDAPGFFRRAAAIHWTLSALFVLCMSALSARIVRTRSTRRTMLVLLLPVMSFGIPFAVASARPDLLGACIVTVFVLAVFLRPHRALLWSAIYGATVSAVTFIHEGIPFEFSLAAILALCLLATDLTSLKRWICVAVAVLPGLAAAGVIVVFAQRDVVDKLCARVPHHPMRMMNNVAEFKQFITTGQAPERDYHRWACGWYVHTYNYDVPAATHDVLRVGVVGLAVSFVLGLAGVWACVRAVQYVAGVPFAEMVKGLRDRWVAPAAALALMIPLFATAIDWTRWMIVVAFNIVIVYLLYVCDKPELDRPVSGRQMRAFSLIVLGFAVFPLAFMSGGSVR